MGTFMSRPYSPVRAFFSDENGATAIEYSLIAGGIAVVIAALVFALGDQVFATYNAVMTSWTAAAGG